MENQRKFSIKTILSQEYFIFLKHIYRVLQALSSDFNKNPFIALYRFNLESYLHLRL